jgi:hypothetical protein
MGGGGFGRPRLFGAVHMGEIWFERLRRSKAGAFIAAALLPAPIQNGVARSEDLAGSQTQPSSKGAESAEQSLDILNFC